MLKKQPPRSCMPGSRAKAKQNNGSLKPSGDNDNSAGEEDDKEDSPSEEEESEESEHEEETTQTDDPRERPVQHLPGWPRGGRDRGGGGWVHRHLDTISFSILVQSFRNENIKRF